MQSKEKTTLRALQAGALVTLSVTYALFALSYRAIAWGFLCGAVISLFSLFSLTVIVPFLFRPGAPRAVKALLGITLFMKLPIYALALLALAYTPVSGVVAAVLGIALSPIVITLQAVAAMAARPASAPAAESHRVLRTQLSIHSARSCAAEIATERG